jgi:putative molybdenum carrier protein
MLTRVISGGQTGADQAGLRAARAAGLPTGGWAPRGWLTEDGPAPWLADWGIVERPARGYPARNRRNVLDSKATVWFGTQDPLGYSTTHNEALDAGRPFLIVAEGITRPAPPEGFGQVP